MFGRTVPGFAENAQGMRFVDHEEAPPFLLEAHECRQVHDVSVHREDAFRHDQGTLRLGSVFLEEPLQRRRVVVGEADAFGARSLRAPDDGIVRERVVKDDVLRPEELADGGNVRRVTAHVNDAVFRTVDVGKKRFQRTVRRTFTRNQTRSAGARPPTVKRGFRRGRDGRMAVQIEIVVGGKIEEGRPVDHGLGLRHALMALEEGIQNPRAFRDAVLHAELAVFRKFGKRERLRVGTPVGVRERPSFLRFARRACASLFLEARKQRRALRTIEPEEGALGFFLRIHANFLFCRVCLKIERR